MYLRTPKRYRPNRRRRQLRLFSKRTVFLLVLIAVLVFTAKLVWENQEQVRESVQPEIESLVEAMQTQVAPKPTPTVTPDVATAQTQCNNAQASKNLELIIDECAVLAENRPNDVDLHYLVTHTLVITSNFGRDQQRINRAGEFAMRTINANPEAPHGWAIQAMVLDWMGDAGGALASALHARALDDTFAPTYAFLGSIYFELGSPELALTYLQRARELDTAGLVVADTFRTEGWIYENQGLYDDAQRAYRTAHDYAPNQSYIVAALASVYLTLQQPDRAFDELERALDLSPEDPLLLFTMGRAYINTGNPERGEEYYRRCLDHDGDNALCMSYLGGFQHDKGDYVSAASTLERALELGSDDLWDYYQLGHSYAALGQCVQALPYLRTGYQKAMAEKNPNATLVDFLEDQLNNCGDISTSLEPLETTSENPQ